MLVKLYIYRKQDGVYLYQDIGNPAAVIDDLGEDKDFTTTAPPDALKVWHWVDGKWI